MAITDARPIPVKNAAYRHYFRIRKNDGSLLEVAWTGIAGTSAIDDAAESSTGATVTQIGTTSRGYVDLTAARMNSDCTGLKVTVTNADAVPYVVDLFPEDTGDIRVTLSDGAHGGASATITGDITGDLSGSVGSVTSSVGSVTNGVTLANGAHGGPAATLALEHVEVISTTLNQNAVTLTGNGSGTGLEATGAKGIEASGTAFGLYTTGVINPIFGSLSGSVGSVTGSVGSVTGSVGSVTGSVGSVTGSVGSVTGGVTLANGDHGGPAATLALEHVEVISTTTDQNAVTLTGNGSGTGLEATGAKGIEASGTAFGVYTTGAINPIFGSLSGSVNSVTNGVTLANGDHGGPEATLALEHVEVISTTTDQAAIALTGEGAGAGIHASGGATGDGIRGEATGSNNYGLLGKNSTGSSGVGIGALGNQALAGKGFYANAQTGFSIAGTSTGFAASGAVSDIVGDITGSLSGSVGSVENLTIGAGGISVTASDYVLTTGNQTSGLYTDTATDGTSHVITDAATVTDFYYEFSVGSSGIPQSVDWTGYAQGPGDTYTVHFYNWAIGNDTFGAADPGWEQVRTLDASSGTSQTTETFTATTSHVGTGSDVGKVLLRFASADGSEIGTNRILCAYTQAATGIANGSSVTLTEATVNTNLVGNNWSLNLGTQDISGSYIRGATVTGVSSATSDVTFEDCRFGAATCPPGNYIRCGFGDSSGTYVAASDGEYVMKDCYSIVPGNSSPSFAMAGKGAATGVNVRGWFGGSIWLLDSNCTISLEVVAGGKQSISSAGAVVEVRGTCKEVEFILSDNDTGNAINSIVDTGPITITALATLDTATINLYGHASAVSDGSSAGTTVNDYMSGFVKANNLTVLSSPEMNTIKTAVWGTDVSAYSGIIDSAGWALDQLQTNQGNWTTATSVTVSDKTGFSLLSTGLDAVTAWTTNITGTVSGNSTHDAAAVATAVDVAGALTAYDGPTKTEMDSAFTEIKGATWTGTDTLEGIYNASGGSTPAQIAAEVWDFDITGTGVGDTLAGNVLTDGATNADLTAAFTEIKGATWTVTDTLENIKSAQADPWATDIVAGAYTGDQAGNILSTNLDAAVSSVGGETPILEGTAEGGTSLTLLDATNLTQGDDDYWNGNAVQFTGGNIAGQVRAITDFDSVTNTITFSPATTQLVVNQPYKIIAGADSIMDDTAAQVVYDYFVDVPNSRADAFKATSVAVSSIDANAITSTAIDSNAIGAAQIAAGAITSTAIDSNAIGATQIAGNAIGSSELATTAVAEIYNYFVDVAASRADAFKADTSLLATQVSVDAIPTAAEIDTELTANHGGAGNWLTATGFNTIAPATPGDVTAAQTAIIARGDEAWVTGDGADLVADAVWREQLSDHSSVTGSTAEYVAARSSQESVDAISTTVGVAGAGLTAIPWGGTTWDTAVESEVNDALTAYDAGNGVSSFNPATDTVANVTTVATTNTNNDMRGTDGANTTTPPTVNAIADQVWIETLGDHSGESGSTAEGLASAVASGSDPWLTPLTGYTGNQAGKMIPDIFEDTGNLDANQGNWVTATGFMLSTENGSSFTAIDLPDQTMNITGDLSGSVGSVTGSVGSVTGSVGSVAGAVQSVSNTVSASITGILGASLNETTADTIAANFSTFYDNADAITNSTVDDVGESASVNKQDVADAMRLTPTGTVELNSVDDQLSALVGATLTGPNTVSFVVTDGASPIEGAKVRMSRTGEAQSKLTDGSGEIAFACETATWDIAVVAVGFESYAAAVAISGDSTQNVELTLIAIPTPADPNLSTMVVKCVDEYGTIEAGVEIKAKITMVPRESEGYAFDRAEQISTSGADGMAYLTVVRLATYKVHREDYRPWVVEVPNASTFSLPSIL